MTLQLRPKIDRDPAVHKARIEFEADRVADRETEAIDKTINRLMELMTFVWLGRCTAVNTTNKTLTIDTDPFPTGVPVHGTVICHWGRPALTAADFLGKRVRYSVNPMLGYFVLVDRVNNE